MFSAEETPVVGQPQGFFMGTHQADQLPKSSGGIPKEKNLFPSLDGQDLCDFEVVQTETHFTEANSVKERFTPAGPQSPRTPADPTSGGSSAFRACSPALDTPDVYIQTPPDHGVSGRRCGGTEPVFNTSDQSSRSLRSDRDSGATPCSCDPNSTDQSHTDNNYRDTHADIGCGEGNSIAVQFISRGSSRDDQPPEDRRNEFGAGARDVLALADGVNNIRLASHPEDSGVLTQMNRTMQMIRQQLDQQAVQIQTLTSLVNEMSAKLDLLHGGRTPPERQASVNFSGCGARDGRAETTDIARGRIVPPPLPRDRSQDPAPLAAGSRPARYNPVEDRSVAHRNALAAQRAAEAEALERKRLEELRAMERRKEEERKRKEEEERKRQEEAARRAAEEQRRREELEEKRKNIMSSLISGQARSSSLFGDDSGPTNKNSLFDD
uniref:Uncharacterized protein n=1 Tax=Neospora caninum (strain Liverpool) TaxID=572307 RepID=A0A0F7UIQ6_NEOCL|nr:TPA: hypothetical protein BN1204_042275 [Neospora caninum Liverpool]